MSKLTANGVKAALSKPGRHSNGDGLILAVGAGDNGPWMVRVQKDGRRRDIGLGQRARSHCSKPTTGRQRTRFGLGRVGRGGNLCGKRLSISADVRG